jgi:sugar/nucleoside kinase (ribokinase family)
MVENIHTWVILFKVARKGSKMKVACVGVHILDVLGRPVVEVPKGQGIALIEEIRITVAGTAGGTAVDLAKLGAEVTCIGALGSDEIGHIVRGILRRFGIDDSGLVAKEGVQTSSTMLPIRPNGERPALHVMGANAVFSEQDVDLDSLKIYDAVHVGGTYLMPSFDGSGAAVVLKHAQDAGALTTMDVLSISRDDMMSVLEPSLPFLNFFMPNLEEAQMITGLEKADDIARLFLDKGVETVILKMGELGSVIYSAEVGEERVPAYAADVVDTTGCGDAYNGGLIYGMCSGLGVIESARLGSACGSLVATGLGSDAGIVDLATVRNFMARTKPLNVAK